MFMIYHQYLILCFLFLLSLLNVLLFVAEILMILRLKYLFHCSNHHSQFHNLLNNNYQFPLPLYRTPPFQDHNHQNNYPNLRLQEDSQKYITVHLSFILFLALFHMDLLAVYIANHTFTIDLSFNCLCRSIIISRPPHNETLVNIKDLWISFSTMIDYQISILVNIGMKRT